MSRKCIPQKYEKFQITNETGKLQVKIKASFCKNVVDFNN